MASATQTYGYLPSCRASLPCERTKLFCLMTKADVCVCVCVCEQLASSCYLKAERPSQRERPKARYTRPVYTGV